MAEYDPTKYMWKAKPVSELSLEEAQQALCHLAELIRGRPSRSQTPYKHTEHGYAFSTSENGDRVGNFYTKD